MFCDVSVMFYGSFIIVPRFFVPVFTTFYHFLPQSPFFTQKTQMKANVSVWVRFGTQMCTLAQCPMALAAHLGS